MVMLGIVGLFASLVFVAAYGRTHLVLGATPPTTWLGLLLVPANGWRGICSVTAWAGMLTLAGCWFGVARLALVGRVGLRPAAAIAGGWAIPFVVGPPLTSLDIYNFATQGRQLLSGISPYTAPPDQLPAGAMLAAVDPRWRHVLSPYGPIGLRFEWLAALFGRGDATATIIWLRVLAVVCTVAAVVLAVRLSRPHRRALTVVLLALNPLLLTTALSAGHLEAPMLALLLGAVLAERTRHPSLSIALALAAGLVKAPALLAVVFLVIEHARDPGQHLSRAKTLLRDGAVLAVVGLAGTLSVPHGWGWTSTVLHTPATGRALWTPSTVLAELAAPVLSLAGVDLSFDRVLTITRLIGLAAVAVLTAVQLRRRMKWEQRLGGCLVALAALGFVLYPWYLLWGVPLLVVGARRRTAFGLAVASAAFTAAYLWPEPQETMAAARALLQALHLAGAVWSLAVLVSVAGGALALARYAYRHGVGPSTPDLWPDDTRGFGQSPCQGEFGSEGAEGGNRTGQKLPPVGGDLLPKHATSSWKGDACACITSGTSGGERNRQS